MTIQFFVPGIPKGAGSKRVFPVKKKNDLGEKVPTGKFIVTDSSGQAGKDWKASVLHYAFQAMRAANMAPLDGALKLSLRFTMPRPKAHYRGKAMELRDDAPVFHISMPDATKLTRAVEDAMTGVVWRDDAQVALQAIEKSYGEQSGCFVKVEPADQFASYQVKKL